MDKDQFLRTISRCCEINPDQASFSQEGKYFQYQDGSYSISYRDGEWTYGDLTGGFEHAPTLSQCIKDRIEHYETFLAQE